ncbi:hypothetical protein AB3Y40_17460 [Yoonia sp. R2331]|uniref:hypothetical protein n=1 Tax=Yoonia sp. R2331 TaxID=3237238 RepID=UPI0034E570F2
MSHRFAFTAALVAAFSAPSALVAQDFSFCWIGANGYSMTGKMQIADGATGVATEADVTAFKIAGYHNGNLLGTWDMRDLRDGATWHLRFDLDTQSFPTGGSFPASYSQGWNANGAVTDCGNPGFGFNSGNHAQDVCVNGSWARDSSIAPDTPLVAVAGANAPTCRQVPLMSKSTKPNHSD